MSIFHEADAFRLERLRLIFSCLPEANGIVAQDYFIKYAWRAGSRPFRSQWKQSLEEAWTCIWLISPWKIFLKASSPLYCPLTLCTEVKKLMWGLLKALLSMCTSSLCATYLVGGTAQSHLWAGLQKPCIPCPLHGFACLGLQPGKWMQKINATQNKLQTWITSSCPMREHFCHALAAGLEQAWPVPLLWDWTGLQSMGPYKSTLKLLVLQRITHNKAEASGNTTKLTTLTEDRFYLSWNPNSALR